MIKELEFEIIYPKIIVYKNVFNDVDKFLEQSKKCIGWEQWYTFGEMLALQEHPIKFNLFPSKEEYMAARHWQSDDDNSKLRAGLTKELGEIFYDVTSHFINKYNDVSLLNWEKNPASVNKYTNGAGISRNYAMNYHTDFVQTEKDMPGNKFGITTTFYLNDNYLNGEICFKINDSYISYKPTKGDVIVFPSSLPYHHAVRKSTGADRYMIRSFWEFNYEGSEKWIENEKKYGKEVWAKMEKDRIKENRFANQIDAESLHEFFGRDNELYK
jgi:hypothetical protein